MATTVKNTGSTAQKFIKPSHIVIREFLGTEADGIAAGNAYILEDVVEDTTSISQDDNETTDIECETSDSPILSIVKAGKYQFASEVADTQAELLKALVGFTTDGSKHFAPAQYTPKYVSVAVVFENNTGAAASYTALIIPRLQLNSKLTIESLNSNIARIGLAGTAQLADIKVSSKSYRTPFYVDSAYTLPANA